MITQHPLFYVRWMIRRDMPEVLSIESRSFWLPWTEEDFVRCLRQRTCIGLIVEEREPPNSLVGYVIYSQHKTKLHILDIAVDPDRRGEGAGRAIVENLKKKLSAQRRNCLELYIRDGNLNAHQFFRHMGFRAVAIEHDYYDEGDNEDAYLFEYRVEEEVAT